MSSIDHHPICRALVSVYDKTGLDYLARGLAKRGVQMVSTGSTAAHIKSYGLDVTLVEEVTDFPEILDGRVKTLHPRIHAGILADRSKKEHREILSELNIEAFDLVIVNLYPFMETVRSGASLENIVEQIDIGGPSMVRASAKNYAHVAIVVNPASYENVLAAIDRGGFSLPERQQLAASAFAHTATYDVGVAQWMGQQTQDDTHGWSSFEGVTLERSTVLRYGENPHQSAALYGVPHGGAGIAQALQRHGKAMSYNNYVDADAALRTAYDFELPAVAIIKHANPCGIGVSEESIAAAYIKAFEGDSLSAFGGVVAANRPVDEALAQELSDMFVEVVIAPSFTPQALEILSVKKNVRLLELPQGYAPAPIEFSQVSGGVLYQQTDRIDAPGDDPRAWRLAAGEPADPSALADAVFAWRAVRGVKSNAILLVKNSGSVGVGMGQVNRVDSAKLAVKRAGAERAHGSIAASDAFFPFADGVQVLLDAGVKVIVQPGGSLRDQEVIEAVEAAGATMYFTGTRHFYH